MSDKDLRNAFKKPIKAIWNPRASISTYEVDPIAEAPMLDARKGKVRRPEKMKNPPKQQSWL